MIGDHGCVFCGALESECDRRIGGKANCCSQCKEYGREAGHLPPLLAADLPGIYARGLRPTYRLDLSARELSTLRLLVNPMAEMAAAFGAGDEIRELMDKVNGAEQI